MALELGVNCGFVTVAPTTDPQGTSAVDMAGYIRGQGDTMPAGYGIITEVGWYAQRTGTSENYEVGIYDKDGENVGDLLKVSRTNNASSSLGWKVASVDWVVPHDVYYFIAVQLDDQTIHKIDRTSGGSDSILKSGQTTLIDPGTTISISTNYLVSIYALISLLPHSKAINIGNAWRDIVGGQINIGDAWKVLF